MDIVYLLAGIISAELKLDQLVRIPAEVARTRTARDGLEELGSLFTAY
jgi:hypothetical protein